MFDVEELVGLSDVVVLFCQLDVGGLVFLFDVVGLVCLFDVSVGYCVKSVVSLEETN